MIKRSQKSKLSRYLKRFPCVAIVGPRQVGKTTLAKELTKDIDKDKLLYLDLELTSDFEKLSDAETYLMQQEDKLVVIDEVQRKPELFPLLRALIDRNRKPGRFLLLGSASPDLIRDSSESLAGRIIYIELTTLTIGEVNDVDRLWLKGGFPEAYLEKDKEFYQAWMSGFIRTYLERDLVQLGFKGNTSKAERLWRMLAHYHGNLINYSELAKSLDVSVPTVQSYTEFLEKAFLIRLLQPYSGNLKKRLVKSPKVYIRDSGILHYFLGITDKDALWGNPKLGSSWEGFVIEQIITQMPLDFKKYFYRTREGSEIDLVIEHQNKILASIEIKVGSKFMPSKGLTMAVQTLKADKNYIVTRKEEEFKTSNGFHVCGLSMFLDKKLWD